MRTRLALGSLVLVTMTVAACSGGGGAAPSAANGAAGRFLARYVTTDGRVIRHDQGGDIVSEGQAYGMLIAELAGENAVARTIWTWTAAHLRQPDGLFAWHASGGGRIEDRQSATDADVLIAYALLRYRGADAASLHVAGRRVATAVLEREAVRLPTGAPVLVAGPWALASPTPTVDPSYLMPGVFDALGAMTGDRRWHAAAREAVSLLRALTHDGALLPPDWAQLQGSSLVAAAAPGGTPAIQYSLDAARLPLWFATACTSPARSLAASWWRRTLSVGRRPARLALSLSGTTLSTAESPLTFMAGAAAASAAGSTTASARWRSEAALLAAREHTYYGDAWIVLGAALLDHRLDPCQEAHDA